jgi:cyclopropane fatty-acyl-phospholipid synthase-like methyltransferase
MPSVSYFSIIERDHTIQNPLSPEGLDRVTAYLGVTDGQRVLDVGCGKAWMLVRWAARWAVHATGLEINPDFVAAAERHAAEAGVRDRVELVTGDAHGYHAQPGAWDVVTCIGASFALGGFEPAVAWMTAAVRPGGTVAIGEVYTDNLAELAATLDQNGLELTGIVPATLQDWDHYDSQHWRSAWTWAQENPDHPDRGWVLGEARRYRDLYLRAERGRLHWAVLVGIKR